MYTVEDEGETNTNSLNVNDKLPNSANLTSLLTVDLFFHVHSRGGVNIIKSFGHPKIFWYDPFGDVLPKKPYPSGQIWGPFWPNQIFHFLSFFGFLEIFSTLYKTTT